MKRLFKKLKRGIWKFWLKIIYIFSAERYKKLYPKYLRGLGINIPEDYYEGGHGFISPSVVFDGNDFSLISIGKNTTISADVIFLTHDYSISKGLKMIGAENSGRFLRPISVGDNCFIGMRSMLLPGTTIGNNVVVGAGAIVKGNFSDGVVIAGNPARVICTTKEWAEKHYEAKDYDIV